MRFLSFTPPQKNLCKETLLRHWDIEKHCSIIDKLEHRLLIYSLLLAPHQRNKWQLNKNGMGCLNKLRYRENTLQRNEMLPIIYIALWAE